MMTRLYVLFLFFIAFVVNSVEGVDPKIFGQKLKDPTPQWMAEQIECDLKPFEHALSRHCLDQFFDELKEGWLLTRVRVVKGQLSVESSHSAKNHDFAARLAFAFGRLRWLLYKNGMHLPDFDLIFSGHDILSNHVLAVRKGKFVPAYPLFVIAKHQHDPGMILMPDWHALEEYGSDKLKILEGNRRFLWHVKDNRLFFRGVDSGCFDRLNWRNCSRVRLVRLSLQRPDLIDAKFVDLTQYEFDPSIRSEMMSQGMLGSPFPVNEIPRYRYLADSDGHPANTPSIGLILFSNSLLFKHNSPDRLWFFKALQPYVHFIPLASDLSDIFSQLEWAKQHDGECQQMVKQANQLAEEVLSPEAVYLYLYHLIEIYSQKQRVVYNKSF